MGERKMELPKAHNLHLLFVGRGIFAIDGQPGLFSRKRPADGEEIIEIQALALIGKGRAARTFYSLRSLNDRLAGALQGATWEDE